MKRYLKKIKAKFYSIAKARNLQKKKSLKYKKLIINIYKKKKYSLKIY